MKTISIIALATLLLSSCDVNCITGEGPVEERVLEIASFTGIEAGGSMQVLVEKGTEQRITVRAQPNLIDLVNTEVKGNTWRIRTSSCFQTDSEFTVHIITPSLINDVEAHGSADIVARHVFGAGSTELSASGSSTITVAGINEKELDVDISGSGAITINGTCSKLEASLSGSGDLHAQELTANEADVEVSGSGKATLVAISKLNAKISGSGAVRYGGNPNVSSSVSGSGSVTPLE